MLGTFGLIEQVHRRIGLHSFSLLPSTQYMALLVDELSHGLPHCLSENIFFCNISTPRWIYSSIFYLQKI